MDSADAVLCLGGDEVRCEGEALTVRSAHYRDDWRVTRYRRTQIRFQGRRYFVQSARPADRGYEYRLAPWPEDLYDLPRATVEYDAAYVMAEDRRKAAARAGDWALLVLVFLGPLVGLLPSRLKLRWHESFGLDPRSCTRQSLFLEYLLLLGSGCLLTIDAFTAAFRDHTHLLLGTAGIVSADLLGRYNALEAGNLEQPGFWEWLPDALRRRKRP